jgi:predicted secreted protein
MKAVFSPWVSALGNRGRCAALALALSMPSLHVAAQAPGVSAATQTWQNVVNFSTTVSVEVPRDVLHVTYSVTKEGADAQSVQTALKQALDAALSEAKKVAKPGQIDVQTGGFNLSPRYSNKGQINGWAGSTELVTSGKDVTAIAQLVGRVQSMTVQRVAYELSREAREKVDADVTAQAIAQFRAKSSEIARQFGFTSYTLREVNVGTNAPTPRPEMPMRARMASADLASESALPTQGGPATVSATVTGSIVLAR